MTIDIPVVGGFLDKALDAVGGIEALDAAINPIRCHLEDLRTNHTKKMDRLPTILFVRDAEASMQGLPNAKIYFKLDILPTKSDFTYRPVGGYTYRDTQTFTQEIDGKFYASNEFFKYILQTDPSFLERPMVIRTVAIESNDKAIFLKLAPATTLTRPRQDPFGQETT